MKISTKGRYAIRLMLDLALDTSGKPVSLNDIASRQQISEKYLEQIISVLNKAGYVKSIRGPQGGYHPRDAGGGGGRPDRHRRHVGGGHQAAGGAGRQGGQGGLPAGAEGAPRPGPPGRVSHGDRDRLRGQVTLRESREKREKKGRISC